MSLILFDLQLNRHNNCVSGLLQGNVYNIPVCLWLLDTYPYNPPICFVKPTSAMMIKTGKHIDANGKIYLPYLHEWKHVSPRFSPQFYLFMFRLSLCFIKNKMIMEIFVVPLPVCDEVFFLTASVRHL